MKIFCLALLSAALLISMPVGQVQAETPTPKLPLYEVGSAELDGNGMFSISVVMEKAANTKNLEALAKKVCADHDCGKYETAVVIFMLHDKNKNQFSYLSMGAFTKGKLTYMADPYK